MTAASQLPDDGSDLARTLRDLAGRLQRIEAARRLGQTGVSSGTAADANGGTPVLTLTTPDLGYGRATVQLRGVSANGHVPASVTLAFPDGTTVTVDRTGAWIEPWAALTTANGWAAAGGSWAPPVLRRQVDGTVQLFGEIAPGTLTAGTVIATLPTGYRPSADATFRVPGGAATAGADLFVTSGGNITLQNVVGTITRIGLSNVRFPVA
jgi:hypothetical protein